MSSTLSYWCLARFLFSTIHILVILNGVVIWHLFLFALEWITYCTVSCTPLPSTIATIYKHRQIGTSAFLCPRDLGGRGLRSQGLGSGLRSLPFQCSCGTFCLLLFPLSRLPFLSLIYSRADKIDFPISPPLTDDHFTY